LPDLYPKEAALRVLGIALRVTEEGIPLTGPTPKEPWFEMGIGASLVLIALGAILAFAVGNAVSFVNLVVIGYILMVVGIIGLIVTLVMFGPRRARRVSETRTAVDPDTGERVTRRETTDGTL
jgi:hypothetical protein